MKKEKRINAFGLSEPFSTRASHCVNVSNRLGATRISLLMKPM